MSLSISNIWNFEFCGGSLRIVLYDELSGTEMFVGIGRDPLFAEGHSK